jgi:hypothetical protein
MRGLNGSTSNQRLNILGHLHLAELGGAAFAQSGNAAALDMLASLQWVCDRRGIGTVVAAGLDIGREADAAQLVGLPRRRV